MKRIVSLGVGLIAVSVWTACTTVVPEFEDDTKIAVANDTIFLIDQTGKAWDITLAVKKFGLRPEEFQFGVGPFSILPIIDPVMLSPGDRGYPGPDERDLVIATTIGGDSRAYKIGDLNSHEVVDDTFGDVHVAVGW
jgi:hypothetical protein